MCKRDYCSLFPDSPKKYWLFGEHIYIGDICKLHDEAWSDNYTIANKLRSDYLLGKRISYRASKFLGFMVWIGVSTVGTFRWIYLKYKHDK